MKLYNTNEKYGDWGPFDAESKEALADEMGDLLRKWAAEKLGEKAMADELNDLLAMMRCEFIAGLVEGDDNE